MSNSGSCERPSPCPVLINPQFRSSRSRTERAKAQFPGNFVSESGRSPDLIESGRVLLFFRRQKRLEYDCGGVQRRATIYLRRVEPDQRSARDHDAGGVGAAYLGPGSLENAARRRGRRGFVGHGDGIGDYPYAVSLSAQSRNVSSIFA